jgi:hypothetical protein
MSNGNSQLKTIASFRDLSLAELAKAKLESEGILCFLQNKNMVAIDWALSFATGGAKLQVPEDHVELARQILDEDNSADLIFAEDDFPTIEKSDLCEKCDSSNLKTLDARYKAGAWFLLLSIPFAIFGKRRQCDDCGHIMKIP